MNIRRSELIDHDRVATEPHWTPAERAIPDLLGDVMYMSYTVTKTGRIIHAYKHCDTRRYILLDDTGAAWSKSRRRMRRTSLPRARLALTL